MAHYLIIVRPPEPILRALQLRPYPLVGGKLQWSAIYFVSDLKAHARQILSMVSTDDIDTRIASVHPIA